MWSVFQCSSLYVVLGDTLRLFPGDWHGWLAIFRDVATVAGSGIFPTFVYRPFQHDIRPPWSFLRHGWIYQAIHFASKKAIGLVTMLLYHNCYHFNCSSCIIISFTSNLLLLEHLLDMNVRYWLTEPYITVVGELQGTMHSGCLITSVLQVWLAVFLASLLVFAATLFILKSNTAFQTPPEYVLYVFISLE